MTFSELIDKGGLAIWPLLFLSILSIGTIIERVWFWIWVLLQQKPILDRIIDTAYRNWDGVHEVTNNYKKHPIAHFLFAPLRLTDPEPEIFHLALETSADDELAMMKRGDKVLEAVIALSPLLGLLGTVLGLIRSLGNIQISDLGTTATTGVTLGIGESLISTAVGLVVAIVSLSFYRIFQGFWFNEMRIFRKAGSEIELIYRQQWTYRQQEENPQLLAEAAPYGVPKESE